MIALATAFRELLALLDRLEIRYVVGGSVASGTHGLPRQTNDIDILAEVDEEVVDEFCDAARTSFYVDSETVEQAVQMGRPFNLIHLRGAFKFDIFPAGDSAFAKSELARRRFVTTTVSGLEDIEFAVATAEDTILAKLQWFRQGGEASERQWHDVLGLMSVQAGRLDEDYMRRWAEAIEVADLLEKILDEARGGKKP